jgi:hydrogenase maturation protease
VQPERLSDFGGSLSECVRARLPQAIELAALELASWGLSVTAREGDEPERLNAAALALPAYESGRPAADEACRVGDARFLNRRHELESR